MANEKTPTKPTISFRCDPKITGDFARHVEACGWREADVLVAFVKSFNALYESRRGFIKWPLHVDDSLADPDELISRYTQREPHDLAVAEDQAPITDGAALDTLSKKLPDAQAAPPPPAPAPESPQTKRRHRRKER